MFGTVAGAGDLGAGIAGAVFFFLFHPYLCF